MKKSELKEIIKEAFDNVMGTIPKGTHVNTPLNDPNDDEEIGEAVKFSYGYPKPKGKPANFTKVGVAIGIVALAKKLAEKRKKIKDPERRKKQKELDDKKLEALRKKKENAKKKNVNEVSAMKAGAAARRAYKTSKEIGKYSGKRTGDVITFFGITALVKKLAQKRKKIKDPEKRSEQKVIDDKKVDALRKEKEKQIDRKE